MRVNKVELGNEVMFDLNADTVSEDSLIEGITAHNAVGEPITGAVVVAPVDSEMSETSENPVQNKVISKAIKGAETLSGSTGYTVNDSAEYPIIGLKVFGRSTQDGTPTPENPVQIISVVNPTVTVCGKNLLNINSYSSDTVKKNQDGSLFINTNGGITISTNTFVLKANRPYSIYIELLSGTISGINNSGIMSNAIGGYYLNLNTTYTVTKNTDTKFSGLWLHNKGVYSNCTFRIMVWEGAKEYKYEPRVAKSLTISDVLNAIPVSSGGNVTIDGQEYIADYVDFEEGRYHRLVDPDKLDPTVSIVDNLNLLLETEEITDILEAEMQAYRQLQTYNGVTNISNDKGAGIEVSYCTNKALSTCVAPITSGLQKQIDDLKATVIGLSGNA